MKIPAIILLLAALVFNASANILMKSGALRLSSGDGKGLIEAYLKNMPLLAGVGCFGLALLFYSLSLNKLELSVCYPIMTGGGLLLVTIASVFFYNEHLSADKILGIVLIFVGTLIVFRRALT